MDRSKPIGKKQRNSVMILGGLLFGFSLSGFGSESIVYHPPLPDSPLFNIPTIGKRFS
jgi:hypothetical protein